MKNQYEYNKGKFDGMKVLSETDEFRMYQISDEGQEEAKRLADEQEASGDTITFNVGKILDRKKHRHIRVKEVINKVSKHIEDNETYFHFDKFPEGLYEKRIKEEVLNLLASVKHQKRTLPEMMDGWSFTWSIGNMLLRMVENERNEIVMNMNNYSKGEEV